MTNRVDFDQYAADYNKLLGEQTQFFSPSEEYFARYKVELVRKNAPGPFGRVLEYGCGVGRNIPFLRAAFPEAVILGSDISGGSLDVARENNPGIEFFLETEPPRREGVEPFDLIFVAGVFHHVPPQQRRGVMDTLVGRLRPGGTAFVFEHNPYNPVTRKIVNDCPFDKDATLLAPSELAGTMRAADLEVLRQGYCLFVPPRFKRLLWLEDVLTWLPLGGQYWVQARRPA